MTTEPTAPKPAGLFPKQVLVAGVLGGLVGAVLSFALARWLPAPPVVPPPKPPSEAREYCDTLLGSLQKEKFDEIAGVQLAVAEAPDEWRERVKKAVSGSRKYCSERFGKPTGDLELLREGRLGETLTRLTYLEKFPRGGVVWGVDLFRGPDGWCLISITVEPLETGYPKAW